MSLICIGLNHKTASIAMREQIAVADVNVIPVLQDIVAQMGVQEAVIVSTCNRMEIYVIAEEAARVTDWLCQYFAVAAEELAPFVYEHFDNAAVKHLIQVACGLDSMVLGEPQILGQLKFSFAKAGEAQSIGKQLGHLFPFVFSSAKKIRTDTAIGVNPVSVAYAAVHLAKHIFADFDKAKVMLIGAGDTISLVAQHFDDMGVKELLIANRTLERAQTLAQRFDAKGIMIGDIPDFLADIDVVVSSTASQLPILGKGLVERVMKQRKHKPIFMVDLAVPRDIEPEVGQLADIYLYNVDDLNNIVEENLHDRQLAAQQAETIIEDEVQHFHQWQSSLEAVPAICAFRQQAEQLRNDAVAEAMQELQRGKSVEEVLQILARNLTNKLMHAPSVQMRKASYEGRNDLLEWAKKLLGLRIED
tara:strand:+ start:109004 stop:110257 length:1254 start_codon:yes stop_codon:yes gene_type:complete